MVLNFDALESFLNTIFKGQYSRLVSE